MAFEVTSSVKQDFDRVLDAVQTKRQQAVNAAYNAANIQEMSAGPDELDAAEERFVLSQLAAKVVRRDKEWNEASGKQAYIDLLAQKLAGSKGNPASKQNEAERIVEEQIQSLIDNLVPAKVPDAKSPEYSLVVLNASSERAFRIGPPPEGETIVSLAVEQMEQRYLLSVLADKAAPLGKIAMKNRRDMYVKAIEERMREMTASGQVERDADFPYAAKAERVVRDVDAKIALALGESRAR